MFRIAALFTTLLFPGQQASPDDITNALAHAEALYYSAHFGESIKLLARVDEMLKEQPGRMREKVNTKLQMALAYIGLNETAEAQSRLAELYALDSDYALDSNQFPPKVVALVADAKKAQVKVRCQEAEQLARTHLNAKNNRALLDLIDSMKTKCPAMGSIEQEAVEAIQKTGLAAFRRGDFSAAMLDFEAVAKLSPENELSSQYIGLIRDKLQLELDRMVLEWRRNFEGRQLTAAASNYQQIRSLNDSAALKPLTAEYRKALTDLVQKWNQACFSNDAASIKTLRTEISDLLPEPNFGQNAGAEINRQCFAMEPQFVLARLRTRVAPTIPFHMRNFFKNSQIVVRVKTRITEDGSVIVTGMSEGNPVLNEAIRAAVTQWKFVPIRDQNGVRCVDTELSLTMSLNQ
jgi:tetratricopeptide (TPR) repeat protein